MMRVTVCQLSDERVAFDREWAALTKHVRDEGSDLLLLPEMPFDVWFAVSPTFDAGAWAHAVDAHERWLARAADLAPTAAAATRPVERDGRRANEGFVQAGPQYRAAHVKALLPREPGFHETSWYGPGNGDFTPIAIGAASVGLQICTEMWSMGHAQHYGKLGAHIIAVPRATSRDSGEKWLAGGRVAAIVSGAYTLSSCRTTADPRVDLGGFGWIIAPDGEVLATTSDREPFQTREVDLSVADRAKATYPRYALS